ncbi:hypothetical protein TetV_356 [Tetraselmis virus 1]|uniref:Uncharacterized protein n=1 Tax=Tetraselmis virus 1 TaxID=2060617 RepID=A0A2P0VNG2_9VIRU|nr:hypothetical protein QJ968_gp356 [Tetraselmis virus 1]AUF82448.1 hypothetical protein TetV_356 [Tetraselmis virus 1]
MSTLYHRFNDKINQIESIFKKDNNHNEECTKNTNNTSDRYSKRKYVVYFKYDLGDSHKRIPFRVNCFDAACQEFDKRTRYPTTIPRPVNRTWDILILEDSHNGEVIKWFINSDN